VLATDAALCTNTACTTVSNQAYADYMTVRASSYSSALDSLASLGCIASHSQTLEIVSKLNTLLSSGLALNSATDVAGAPPLQVCELIHDLLSGAYCNRRK
jgi:hypothetical protein